VLTERILKGERADVVFTAGARLPALEKAGKIIPQSRVELGGAYVAVAIRAGAFKPDLSDAEAVKQLIKTAKVVAISDPSGGAVQGRFVLDLADRFKFDQELRSRFKLIPGGGNRVAEAVANGEADIGITLSTEIVYVKGAEIAGPLPPEMQNLAVFYAVMMADSREPEAAKEFMAFMLTPEAKRVTKEYGVAPR
jgi:molybdate transport system substrate-binding protein